MSVPALLVAVAALTDVFGQREDTDSSLHDISSGKLKYPISESFTSLPTVAIHTLTSAKRRNLDENLLRNWKRSTYPGHLTLMVYDQSETPSHLLQSQQSVAKNRRIEYVFRNVSVEGMVVTGVSRNKMLSRTSTDAVVLMDSDDFYFPDYVSYMVEGLLSRKVLYFGLLGYYCTKMSAGKVQGVGFSYNPELAPKHSDLPTVGFGIAFFTFMRDWAGFTHVQASEELGLTNILTYLPQVYDARGENSEYQLTLRQELLEHCQGKRNDTSRWRTHDHELSVRLGLPSTRGDDEVDLSKSVYLQNIASHPLPMWQAKQRMCESLFAGREGLWGWAFDVHGHVSKTVWKSMLTDGLHKCKGDQADCGELRAEGQITPVLQDMHDFVRTKQSEGNQGAAATMHTFVLHSNLTGTSCPSAPSVWAMAHTLFSREVYCHFNVDASQLDELVEDCDPGNSATKAIIGQGLVCVGEEC
jgi:hypothetical protein